MGTYDVKIRYHDGIGSYDIVSGVTEIECDVISGMPGVVRLYGTDVQINGVAHTPVLAVIPLTDVRFIARVDALASA